MLRTILVAAAGVCFPWSPAHAAVPDDLKSATHVIQGRLTGIYTKHTGNDQDGRWDRYVLEIIVENVLQGPGPEAGKTIYVQLSKMTKQSTPIPSGLQPTPTVPSEGERIRVFLTLNKEGVYRVMGNSAAIEKVEVRKTK